MKFRELIAEIVDQIYLFGRDRFSRTIEFLQILHEKWPEDQDSTFREWFGERIQKDFIDLVSDGDPRGQPIFNWEALKSPSGKVYLFDKNFGPNLDEEQDADLILFNQELKILLKYSDHLY